MKRAILTYAYFFEYRADYLSLLESYARYWSNPGPRMTHLPIPRRVRDWSAFCATHSE